MKHFDSKPLIPGPIPPDIKSDKEEFNVQVGDVGPPYQYNVDYDDSLMNAHKMVTAHLEQCQLILWGTLP